MSEKHDFIIRNINIFNVPNLTDFAQYLCADSQVKTGMLIAINAEKVIAYEENQTLRKIIDKAEYKYADGISLIHSIHKKYKNSQVQRIAGADLWEALMKKAGELSIPVFLVGGKPEILAKTKEQLINRWNVNIVGEENGYFSEEKQSDLLQRIAESGAKIVTIAMGTPKQEIFMQACQEYYPQALYMGVGGTYDVFTGHVKRAPKIWRRLGLEWLYRLLKQPTRWKRQRNLLKFLYYYYSNQL